MYKVLPKNTTVVKQNRKKYRRGPRSLSDLENHVPKIPHRGTGKIQEFSYKISVSPCEILELFAKVQQTPGDFRGFPSLSHSTEESRPLF
jgi:hypothetical protein